MIVLHAAHAGHLCDVAVGSIGYLLLSDATQTVQVVISERFGKMAGVVGPAVQVTLSECRSRRQSLGCCQPFGW